VRGDVRDLNALRRTIDELAPTVVFHLAAQPIVLRSYSEPKETFDVNVGGTVNVLESVRTTRSVRALVCITTDKVYETKEWIWGYREIDSLGGHDPYSASKAMAELAIGAYRRSFFPRESFSEHRVAIASTRAGNVIGGGDWAPYRIVPDAVRALFAGEPVHVRNPQFFRPWQYVLEPLSGYLWLAMKLLQENGHEFAEAWNFGPLEPQRITCENLVNTAIRFWGEGSIRIDNARSGLETGLLKLSWEKAANRLGWRPVYTWEEAIANTVSWYKTYQHQRNRPGPIDVYDVCLEHIRTYTQRARELGVEWASAETPSG
jgi:CDP-glucose 4,6-dehydratase